MTKRDFELIARALKDGFESSDMTARDKAIVLSAFVRELAAEKSRFDEVKFKTAILR
jgi:hypothetical protein